MNPKQKKIIAAGLILAMLACLFPPHLFEDGFIFVINNNRIAWSKVVAELLVIIFGTACLYLLIGQWSISSHIKKSISSHIKKGGTDSLNEVAKLNYPGVIAEEKDSLTCWYYFKECITSKYDQFSGRARRKEWWGFIIFTNIFLGVLMMIFVGAGAAVIGVILGVVLIIPSFSVLTRRMHDIGFSGWIIVLPLVWIAFCLINNSNAIIVGWIVNLGIYAMAAFVPSSKRSNKYGSVPKGIVTDV